MTFKRYVPVWSGWDGGPGYTVFNFDQAGGGSDVGIANAVRGFFDSLKNYIPAPIKIVFPGEMTLHSDDGTLIGANPVSPAPAELVCTGVTSYAAPAGSRITWETGSIVGGRRIRGRTFIVPNVNTAFQNDGTLATAYMTALLGAGNSMITALASAGHKLVVWSPTTSTISEVASCTVQDQVTVLRSRRD